MQMHTNHRRTSRLIGFIPMCAFIITLAATLTPSTPAQAASVSFFLDQSNELQDGVNYLSVTLTESGDGVNVLVQTLDPLNSIAGDHFGIQAFGFGLCDCEVEEIAGLPDGWTVRLNKRMDGFGRFDFRLQGRGGARTDELSLTVVCADLGDFGSLFAAHVAGFEWGTNSITSAYFGGAEPVPIPVLPAVWLFGSALIGLIGVARRRQA